MKKLKRCEYCHKLIRNKGSQPICMKKDCEISDNVTITISEYYHNNCPKVKNEQ